MKYLKTFILIISFFYGNFNELLSQGTAGNKASYESRFIVDMPTAGVLKDDMYSIIGAVYPKGGFMAGFDVAFLKYFNAGIRFSGNNIVGDGEINWQWIPGFSLKSRIFDERKASPAITVGFESQGSSNYIENHRFNTHSPGLFLALSKNYIWDLGQLALHGGLNYSFDPNSDERSPNIYGGIEQSFGSYIAINLEYNFQLDETEDLYYTKRGLVNASIRGSLANGITAEIRFRDILNHSKYSEGHERIVAVEIIKFL
jgi:hypothetical protein